MKLQRSECQKTCVRCADEKIDATSNCFKKLVLMLKSCGMNSRA